MVLFAGLHEDDLKPVHAPIKDLEYLVGHALIRMGQTAASLRTLRAGVGKRCATRTAGPAHRACCARAT